MKPHMTHTVIQMPASDNILLVIFCFFEEFLYGVIKDFSDVSEERIVSI